MHPEGEEPNRGHPGRREPSPGRGCFAPVFRVVLRAALPVLLAYLAVGYLTTAVRHLEVTVAPPSTRTIPELDGGLLTGVLSVHTGRSHDARGTRDQVAEAAAEAGLDFVVVGDHPRDDRRPDWRLWDPRFLGGILVIGGQELRTPEAGKILALGVDTTYKRWQGDYGSFVAFLESEEATAFAVHGRGRRGSERWVHPTAEGLAGWEVLDISEFARRRLAGPWSLYHAVTLLGGLPFGLGDEALLHTLRDGFDTPAVAAYDSLRLHHPLTATAGLNVHPKVEVGSRLFPPYAPFFRTLLTHVALKRDGAEAEGEMTSSQGSSLPLDPLAARGALSASLRSGNVFVSLGRGEEARRFRFMAILSEPDSGAGSGPTNHLSMGGEASLERDTRLRVGFVGSGASPGRLLYRVMRDGEEMAWFRGRDLEWRVDRPGLYRVEVYTYSARLGSLYVRLRPWIFSNPLRLVDPTGGTPSQSGGTEPAGDFL